MCNCHSRAVRRSTTNPNRRATGTDTTKAVQAGSAVFYEALSASGKPMHRFTSLIGAQNYINRRPGYTIRRAP